MFNFVKKIFFNQIQQTFTCSVDLIKRFFNEEGFIIKETFNEFVIFLKKEQKYILNFIHKCDPYIDLIRESKSNFKLVLTNSTLGIFTISIEGWRICK